MGCTHTQNTSPHIYTYIHTYTTRASHLVAVLMRYLMTSNCMNSGERERWGATFSLVILYSQEEKTPQSLLNITLLCGGSVRHRNASLSMSKRSGDMPASGHPAY